jgi:ribosomal protein L7/L12
MNSEISTQLPASVVEALSQGQKIEAIKLLRTANGMGLKESKDAVEAFIKTRPDLALKFEAMQKEATSAFSRWLFILGLLAVAAYWFLVKKQSG